jgi:hypothetical protein
MLLDIFIDIIRIGIFPLILGILIFLIAFLVIKDTRKRAKLGIVAGAFLILLYFLFIFTSIFF